MALPAHIAGVGRGQSLGDGEARPIILDRFGEAALRPQRVAGFLVGHRQIMLPPGMLRIDGDQLFADGQPIAVALEGVGEISFCHQSVADIVV